MSENELEGQEASLGKEAEIREVLSKQFDQLIALGFHNTLANPAYTQGKPYDKPLETSFREMLQDTVRPENVDEPSKLVVVIPRIRLSDIADLQDIEGIEKWDWYDPSLDSALPLVPYALEITRGNPDEAPKDLVKETRGRMRSVLHTFENSSFDAVSTALGKKEQRGLTGHELLAYARVHPDGFEKIHGLAHKQGLRGNNYFPSLVRSESGLRCQRTPILSEAKSMAEIPCTKSKQTLRAPNPQ